MVFMAVMDGITDISDGAIRYFQAASRGGKSRKLKILQRQSMPEIQATIAVLLISFIFSFGTPKASALHARLHDTAWEEIIYVATDMSVGTRQKKFFPILAGILFNKI